MRLPSTVLSNFKQLLRHTSDTSQNFAILHGLVFSSSRRYMSNEVGMQLNDVVGRLKTYAPLSLAASWDNVGLLVEPSSPHVVSNLLLTNDLTQEVMEEALKVKANMVICYHPPIFQPLKRLTQKTWKERLIVKCIENRIAIYSPHTTYDALCSGINDWLIAPFEGKSEPIETSSDAPTLGEYSVAVNLPDGIPDGIEKQLVDTVLGVNVVGYTSLGPSSGKAVRLSLNCRKQSLPGVASFFEKIKPSSLEIVKLAELPMPGYGCGRLTTLNKPIAISDAVKLIKSHLKMNYVRLAIGYGQTSESLIRSVAVCAGSGGSVLRGVKADLYLTGEMSHHEVLDAAQNGTSVVLCDHSNTERGFLVILQQTLDVLFEHKIAIHVSATDKDPLEVV